MKKIYVIILAVFLALVIAGGSFYGGMAYQKNQVSAIQNRFAQRGGLQPGIEITPGAFPGQGRNGFGGGASGQIKSIEGNVLSLSTAQNVTTVNLSDATIILKSVNGTIADLLPGLRVMVIGQADSNGVINATQITIENELFNLMPTLTP
jgi:hypothetical protein